MDKKLLKRGRLMYILEASLEYLISILVSGAYLATLTKSIGIDDALTGIISSFISLGCLFQLIAMFVFKGRVKGAVISLSVINQILFLLLYVVPLPTLISPNVKIGLFIAIILLAYFTYNIAHPAKINWMMSLVDDSIRGRFTAKKEVVSLIVGTCFSFGMGAIIDAFKARGDLKTAFIISGIVIFVLMVLHTISMALAPEKEPPRGEKKSLKGVFSVLKDKNVIKVTVVFSLWNIATYSAVPFYGTYQTSELGFDMKFIAIGLGLTYTIARTTFSFVWGAYADKHSFSSMIKICFAIAGASFLINAFCTPFNGHIVYTIHYVLYAISMAGINSALINLCYDYVGEEKRRDALAVSQAISGLVGFGTTSLVSLLVSYIQKNDNSLFGMGVYAQQVCSFIALIFTMLCILYVSIFMKKKSVQVVKK